MKRRWTETLDRHTDERANREVLLIFGMNYDHGTTKNKYKYGTYTYTTSHIKPTNTYTIIAPTARGMQHRVPSLPTSITLAAVARAHYRRRVNVRRAGCRIYQQRQPHRYGVRVLSVCRGANGLFGRGRGRAMCLPVCRCRAYFQTHDLSAPRICWYFESITARAEFKATRR